MMISQLSGNSRILLTLDEQGNWTDLYYPFPGLHQQLLQARLGVFDEGTQKLHWIGRGEPPYESGYVDGSNAARTRIERAGLDLTLDDMVHPNLDVVIRRVTLRNPEDTTRKLRVFHYQSLNIAGSLYQDTAYWDPERRTINHYKRSYHFQIAGHPQFDGFTCGEHTLKGLRGSYVDAEDGVLEGNAISHGSADSIVQWDIEVPPGEERIVHLFVMIARSRQDVNALYDSIDGRDPALFTSEAVGYWNHWAENKGLPAGGNLSQRARDVHRRSLFVLQGCTSSGGAIIASPDSRTLKSGGDSYNYCWWRDGGYICRAMSESGLHNLAMAFLQFASECQEPEGCFMHRHFPDGYLGATWHPPTFLQIDQTASVIDAVHHHYECTGDMDVLLQHWDMVRRGADHLMEFVDERGLPLPSFDLWEEKKAVNTYSVAMVVRGLRAAARIALALAKRSDYWTRAADRMQHAALRHLWNDEKNTWYKSIDPIDDTIDASTLLAENLFPTGDPRADQVVETVEQRLWIEATGGIARYEGDQYYGLENPWIICTLWLAQAHIRRGRLERAEQLIEWVVDQAGAGDLLPEQVDARRGDHTSVTPLVWSHSTLLETINAYLKMSQVPQARPTAALVSGESR